MAARLSTVKRPSALEFNFETRFVVLNFLGQVPVTPSSSSRTSFATSLTNRSSLQSQVCLFIAPLFCLPSQKYV